MADVRTETDHGRERRDAFVFHFGGRWTTFPGMVVRVEPHGGEVTDERRRVWRFHHLPGVARMEERIVVRQAFGELFERDAELFVGHVMGRVWLHRAELLGPVVGEVSRAG